MSETERAEATGEPSAADESAGSGPARAATTSRYDTLIRITAPSLWLGLGAIVAVIIVAIVWSVAYDLDEGVSGQGVVLPDGGVRSVVFSDAGTLERYTVEPGDEVATGDVVAVVQGADGASDVTATIDGTVMQTSAVPGAAVEAGHAALVLRPEGQVDVVYAYVPVGEGKAVVPGQDVRLEPVQAGASGLQYFEGTVSSVTALPVSAAEIGTLAGSPSLGDALTLGEPVLQVLVSLEADPTTTSGVAASNRHGDDQPIPTGSVVEVTVVTRTVHPIDKVFS